jgi:hypothetical protein
MEPPKDAEIIDMPTSTVWIDGDGILYSISKKVPPQTVEESRKTLEDFKKITNGKKFCMLLDVTNSSPTDKETREFAAEELPKIVTALAMISDSPLGRMVANLFFALKPPPYPAKMFANEEDAKAWLLQYL